MRVNLLVTNERHMDVLTPVTPGMRVILCKMKFSYSAMSFVTILSRKSSSPVMW